MLSAFVFGIPGIQKLLIDLKLTLIKFLTSSYSVLNFNFPLAENLIMLLNFCVWENFQLFEKRSKQDHQ